MKFNTKLVATLMLAIYWLSMGMESFDSEWQAYKNAAIEYDIIIFIAIAGAIFVTIASPFLLLWSAIKRDTVSSGLAVIIMLASTSIYVFSWQIKSIEMETKAYLFYLMPQLCQQPQHEVDGVLVCYRYINQGGIDGAEAIVFDPGHEMSLPPNQWPAHIVNLFFNAASAADSKYCAIRKTRQIVNDVYWVSNDC